MSSFFDITSKRFFIPLASLNKELYLDTIFFLNKLIADLDDGNENDKPLIIKKLSEHLDDLVNIDIYNDETNEQEINIVDNQIKAALLINKLRDYNWIFEEGIGDKVTLNFYDYSYSFIKLITELSSNTKRQYTGYIRQISNAIHKFDYSRIDDFEFIDKELEDFVTALKSLHSNVQRYYRNITRNKNSYELEQLLDEFTGDYKENFFDTAYINLKIRDNFDSEIPKITEKLESLFLDFSKVEKLVNARIDKDYDFDRANNYVIDTKKKILSNIRSIPSLMERIDSKNEKYVTRTVSVIIYMISRGKDIEGILHRLIDYVKDDYIEDTSLVNFFSMKHYTFNALAKPASKSVKAAPSMIEMGLSVSEETIKNNLEILKMDQKYNIYAINDFVVEFLKDSRYRYISELKLNSKYELIMIVSIMMYSKVINAIYEIELTNERINKNGVSFYNFKLFLKGGPYD